MASYLEELQARKAELQSIIDGGQAVDPNQNTGWLGDTATDVKRGFQQIPGALAGIPDIVTGAAFGVRPVGAITDYIGEATGYQPGRWAEEARAEYSPERQAVDAKMAAADGFMETIETGLKNPRAITGLVAESLPQMLAGGAIGRGLLAAGALRGGAAAAGVGEGTIAAGSAMDAMTQQGLDPRTAGLAAAATGAVVGAIGVGGATLAQKMKLADPDMVVAGLGGAPIATAIGATTRLGKAAELGSRMGRGAIQEGLIEELPQSVAETMISNIAQGKDITEGIGEAAAQGLLAGGAMGGAFNIKGRKSPDLPAELTAKEIQARVAATEPEALQAMADSFTTRIENIIDLPRNLVGGKRSERLRAMLDGEGKNTIAGIEEAIKGLPVKTVQAQIRRDPYYIALKAKEEAGEAVPKTTPAEQVVEEAPGPDLPVEPASRETMSPEDQAAMIAELDEAGIELVDDTPVDETAPEGVDEVAPAPEAEVPDVGTRRATEPTDTELDQPAAGNTAGATRRTLRGLAGLINGFTSDTKEKADIAAYNKAGKDITARFKAMKQALPELYTKTGSPRATTPDDVKVFLNKLPELGEKYSGDNRFLAGLRKRANTLATVHSMPELERQVNLLTHGYELQNRAKAVAPLTQETRLNLQRLGITTDTADADNVDKMFSDLHQLIGEFDKKVQAVSSDPKNVVTDIQRVPAIAGQKATMDTQLGHAAAAKDFILGRGGPASGANLFALQEAIGAQFAKLEAKVGRKTLMQAMGESKRNVTKTRKALPGVKPDQESSAGMLFSTLYANYRDNGDRIDLRPSIRAVRLLNEQQKQRASVYKDAATGKKVPYRPVVYLPENKEGEYEVSKAAKQPKSRMEQKLDNQKKHRKVGAPPVVLLLDTLARHSMSPVSRLLAKKFTTILEQSDYIKRIGLVLHPEDLGPDNQAGQFTAMKADADGNVTQEPTMQLWGRGTRETTILHETMHAITMGVVSQWKNDPTSVKATQADALRSLSTMHKDVTATLRGTKDNTKKPLGGRLDHLLDILEKPNAGLDEFLTYALTDNDLQNWMKRHPAGEGYKLNKKSTNWWQVFTAKMKTLLGVQNIPNQQFVNFLDAYVESTSTLLGSISDQAGKEGVEIFFFEPASRGNSTVADTGVRVETADPTKPEMFATSNIEVAESVKKNAKRIDALRAIQKKAQEQTIAENTTEEAQRNKEAIARNVERGKRTTVTKRKKQTPGPRNATYIDKLERTIADGVVNFASAGKYKNYEDFANEMLSKSGTAVREYSKRDSWTAQTLGKFLSKTVDSYGVPDAYRNVMGAFEGAFRGKFNEAYVTYDTLLSLTADQQQSLLDYLYNDDDAQLEANIPDERQRDTITKLVSGLNELKDRAVAEGMIAEKDKNKSLADFINMSEGAFRIVNKVSFSQITAPSDKNNRIMFSGDGDGKTSWVPRSNIIDKYGAPVDTAVDKQFHMTADKDGNFYAIEVGADASVWDDFRVAPLSDPRPFLVSNPDTTAPDVTFYRKVTVAERHEAARDKEGESVFNNSPKARAHVISGLTRLSQEWGRNIQGREIVRGMVDTNNGLEDPDARWIRKTRPTKTDGSRMDGSRIVRIAEDNEARKSKALKAKLRVPGNWAYIEDNAENRKLFGDMAGYYVAGPVYSSMLDYYDTTPLINSDTFRATLTMWKKGKTIFSPVAHVNNISGNIMLAYYYDIPAENIIKALQIVGHEMMWSSWQKAHPLNAEQKALRQEMNDQGITLAQAKTADFDVASDISFSDWADRKASATGIRGLASAFTYIEGLSSKVSDIYSNQDNIFRLATYMTHIQDNATAEQIASGNVGADLKAEAALKAERAFVDYRIHAPWIKAARESITPFIAWPYRMFPLLMKTMITKPWKAANTAMAITALNSLAYSMLGADGDEEEERNLMPEWHKQGIAWMPWVPSNIRLPMGSGDNAYFLNLSRTVTLADMDQVTGSGVPSMLLPGGPAAILMYAGIGVDPFTGKELSTGAEDTAGFIKSRAEYIARGMLPGAVTSIMTAVKHQGETGPLGYDHSFWVDAAKVLGFSSFQMNIPEAAFYKDISRKQAQRLFNTEISRTWRNELRQKSPDYEAAAETEIELQRRLTERLQELAGET
jgi:hypothetical protein